MPKPLDDSRIKFFKSIRDSNYKADKFVQALRDHYNVTLIRTINQLAAKGDISATYLQFRMKQNAINQASLSSVENFLPAKPNTFSQAARDAAVPQSYPIVKQPLAKRPDSENPSAKEDEEDENDFSIVPCEHKAQDKPAAGAIPGSSAVAMKQDEAYESIPPASVVAGKAWSFTALLFLAGSGRSLLANLFNLQSLRQRPTKVQIYFTHLAKSYGPGRFVTDETKTP